MSQSPVAASVVCLTSLAAVTLTGGKLEDPHKVSGLYVRRPFSSHCGRPVYQRVESSVIDVTQYTSTDMGQAALTETLLYYRDAAPNVSQRRSSRLGSPGTRGEAHCPSSCS